MSMKITINTMAQMRNALEASGHRYEVYGDTLITDRSPGVAEGMSCYFGKTIDVAEVLDSGTYRANGWSWGDWMVSNVEGGDVWR